MMTEKFVGQEQAEGPVWPGNGPSVETPENTAVQPGWTTSQEGKEEPLEEHWEAQQQEFLETGRPVHTTCGNPGLSEAAPWEDAKAFLASFEQVAKAFRWPRGEWAARLLPTLSGEAEQAFRSLEAGDQEDYGKVKAAILRGEALRREVQRQLFRQFCCQEVEDPRRLHRQLQELCRQWLKPERHSKEQILELLILEQFLASLPPDLQGWIRAGGPDSCSQAVALVEDFLRSQEAVEAATWQGLLKEECEDFLDAGREPLNPTKVYEDAEQPDEDMGHTNAKEACSVLGLLKEECEDFLEAGREPLNPMKVYKDAEQIGMENNFQTSADHLHCSQEDHTGGKVAGDILGLLKEECEDFLDAEREPSDPIQVYEDAKQSGIGIAGPSPLPPEQEMDLPGGKETCGLLGELKLNERSFLLQVGRQISQHPAQESVAWSHLQGDVGSSGDKKECQVKLETPRCGGKEAEGSPGTAPEMSQANILGMVELHQGAGKSNEGQEKQRAGRRSKCNELSDGPAAAISQPSNVQTRGSLPRFSKYGRRYRYRLEPDTMDTREEGVNDYDKGDCDDHDDTWPASGESLPQSAWLDHPPRRRKERSRSALSGNGEGDNLSRHQTGHPEEKHHDSNGCIKSFGHSVTPNSNRVIPSEGGADECVRLSRFLNQKEHLLDHEQGHPGEKGLECPRSEELFTFSEQEIPSGEKPYKCSQCGKCFRHNGKLMCHQRIHTGEKPYRCSQCGKCFSFLQNMKRHQRIHSGEKPYRCSQCPKCFCEKDKLKEHQRIHTGEKPYKCLECGKSFRLSTNRKEHQRIHTTEKPYKCLECGESFRWSKCLRGHQRIHTGEKPYKCPECGKNFRLSKNLREHQRIHTGEKPYKCSQCGKFFRKIQDRQRHQKTHTGEKPNKCLECGKSFRLNKNLREHQKIHTQEQPYECS